jgi:hypothetical protein
MHQKRLHQCDSYGHLLRKRLEKAVEYKMIIIGMKAADWGAGKTSGSSARNKVGNQEIFFT